MLCSQLQGWFTHTSANRVGSIVVPRQSIEPVLLSVAADGCIGTALPLKARSSAASDNDGEASLSHPCHHKTDEESGHISQSHIFSVGSPTPPPTGSVPQSCPGEVRVCSPE